MILTIFCWVALILFVGLSLKKAKQFSSLPMHGRQDLYPIPLEDARICQGHCCPKKM